MGCTFLYKVEIRHLHFAEFNSRSKETGRPQRREEREREREEGKKKTDSAIDRHTLCRRKSLQYALRQASNDLYHPSIDLRDWSTQHRVFLPLFLSFNTCKRPARNMHPTDPSLANRTEHLSPEYHKGSVYFLSSLFFFLFSHSSFLDFFPLLPLQVLQ